ncbi:MAG: transporter substrate-binding domain-containing protein [Desulfobacteraceae bacterium]|nr:transporter substrate-binding domain-containing protein [Desulfobacteraceae bacterium]
MKKPIAIFLVCSIFQLFVCGTSLLARQTLTLNTAGNPPLHTPDQTGIIDLLVKEAFRRISKDVILQYLPPERALINANQGIEDGDMARIGGLSAAYPNLIQVPEKVFETDFVAFTRMKELQLRNWQDLQPYDVAVIKGHKISEQNVIGTRSLLKANNIEILFNLLKNKRADIVVCERLFGLAMKKKLHLDDVRIVKPPLASLDFFIYLHRKHESLVDELASALIEMREDGTYRKIYPGAKQKGK